MHGSEVNRGIYPKEIWEDYRTWIILLLALCVRLLGIDYGLPDLFHQDEPIIVNHALALAVSGPNPHFFVIPPLSMYFVFSVSCILYIWNIITGAVSSPDQFALLFIKDPSQVYYWGRIAVGCVAGLATVVVFMMGAFRNLGKREALIGAGFFAVNFFHVQHSHYIYADILLTLAVTTLFFVGLSFEKNQSYRSSVLAGICLGVGASAKYTMMYFAPVVFFYRLATHHGRLKFSQNLTSCFLMVLSTIVSYLCLHPYTLLDWSSFSQQIMNQAGAADADGIIHHFRYSLYEGIRAPLLLLALLGGIVLIRQRLLQSVYVIGFIGFYYGINVFFTQPFARYMLPVVPIVLYLFLIAIRKIITAGKRWKRFTVILLTVLWIMELYPTMYMNYLFIQPDTRTLAKQWVYENLPEGSGIALASRAYAPRLRQSKAQVEDKYSYLGSGGADSSKRKRLDLEIQAIQNEKTYRLYKMDFNPTAEVNKFLFLRPYTSIDAESFEENQIHYVVLHHRELLNDLKKFKEIHAARLRKIITFSPYHDSGKIHSLDPYEATAAPHVRKEIYSRKRLGPVLDIYEYLN